MANPRSATAQHIQSSPRNESRTVSRGDGTASGVVARGATRNVSRSATNTNVVSRGATPAKAGVARSASVATRNVSRSAAPAVSKSGRSATTPVASGVARAASVARATAVFNDLSKIGGGYLTCRDAYATCMDQFCAKANDTYRRCYCSARFTDIRNMETGLDEAAVLLQQFENNNLSVIDKTAAEVEAMYSATAGELAVKNDVSGAQSLLNEIGDLLSGKKKTTAAESMGLMEVDFSSDVDDIWAGGSSSMFDTDSGTDLSALEGAALYNSANKQCMDVIAASCENSAVLNMAASAYNIMITQDCNTYERSLDSRREKVESSVRNMEKALRDARLAEYQSHNSADVNECIAEVKTAITADAACGANYIHCLDYTGRYVNQETGELYLKSDAFNLTSLITLDGTSDILGANDSFNAELDKYRNRAAAALDTCRDQADIVWDEFKRQAIIEIAQAQDDIVEQAKMSCVADVTECYDTQSGDFKELGGSIASDKVGAMSWAAARTQCKKKLNACAALYGNGNCNFYEDGRISNASDCGADALLNLVNVVDTARIEQGCKSALESYATELCTTSAGDKGYPWNCIKMPEQQLRNNLNAKSQNVCVTATGIDSDTDAIIENVVNSVKSAVAYALQSECEGMDGLWYEAGTDLATQAAAGANIDKQFYSSVYGQVTLPDTYTDYGICIEDTERWACEEQDDITGIDGSATWNATRQECVFAQSWYEWACSNMLNGYLKDGICYWDASGVEAQ